LRKKPKKESVSEPKSVSKSASDEKKDKSKPSKEQINDNAVKGIVEIEENRNRTTSHDDE